MSRVVVTEGVPAGLLEPLAQHDIVMPGPGVHMCASEMADACRGAVGLVCFLSDVVGTPQLADAPLLQVVGCVAAGVDNVDLTAAAQRGLVVCNSPDGPTESTAELAVLLMLAAVRRLGVAQASLADRTWPGWAFEQFWGFDLQGAVLGLVGHGRIAQALERRAAALGMEVLHVTRTDTGEPGRVSGLSELLRRSDVVSLHVPLNATTRCMVDDAFLARMKPSAVLVNTSRGAVIDEAALVRALRADQIFGVGLDVFTGEPHVDPELLSDPRIVCAPHIGSATGRTRSRMFRDVAGDVAAVLDGRTAQRAVSLPAG